MPKKSGAAKKASKKGSIFEKPKADEEEAVGEPEGFLEGDEHSDSHAEHSLKIRVGDQEEDVYTQEGREEMEESDEIAPWEEGFAEGAEGSEGAVCANCNKILGDREESVIEREIKGKLILFCSEKCAKAGAKGKKE